MPKRRKKNIAMIKEGSFTKISLDFFSKMRLFIPVAYLDLKIVLSLQCMWYLELQKSNSDVQSPSLECISAQSMEINRLRKQIC